MEAYATVEQVAAGYRALSTSEQSICTALLEEAALIIDAVAFDADDDIKRVVSCRMVRRAIGGSDSGFPIGANQGAMTAGPYTQSWTVGSGGTTGELYLSKNDKRMLGIGDKIGASNPYARLIPRA